MEQKPSTQLAQFNRIYQELDGIYHIYAKANALSDTALFALCSLWEEGGRCGQQELCEDWSCPPQTMNSALKSLERRGILTLSLAKGSRRSKEACLTPQGNVLAAQVIAPLAEAEQRAFFSLDEEEREVLLRAARRYAAALRAETDRCITKE